MASETRRPIVIGTAGHVDHGKTALVKALTGVDTDRLPEEKAREISIELGFAPLTLPDGTVVSVVDVPGHEKFIKNMLAGATGVDVVLLVVDAREGVQPQTVEHLDILGLLGAANGVAALTKIDTVGPESVGPAADALAVYLTRTGLAGCPVIPVSARTGAGLDDLRTALAAAVERAERARAGPDAAGSPGAQAPPAAAGPARLAVDRAFSTPGFGVVVTGTVASGRIATGQRLQVYPAGPVVRVRRLEAHGRPVEAVVAGDRAALALAGDLAAVEETAWRGSVLAEPGTLEPARTAGLGLRLLPASAPLKDLERVRLHAGTAETLGRVILLSGQKELAPAPAQTPVLFEAERPLALARGQAFVIRTYSPPRTVGGGTVLAPSLAAEVEDRPRTRAARAAAAAALAAPAPDAGRPPVPGGCAPLAQYLRLIGASGVAAPSPVTGSASNASVAASRLPPGVRLLASGQHVVEETFYQEVWSEAAARLREQHEARPHLETVGRETLWSWLESRRLPPAAWLDTFVADGLVALLPGRVRLAAWSPRRPAGLATSARVLAERFRAGGFSPPSFAEAAAGLTGEAAPHAREALEVLLSDGELACLTGVAGVLRGDPAFHRETVALARQRLEDYLGAHGEVTVAAFRDLVGSTRKYALPLLELFDRDKVTLRRGDVRVRHPANPGLAAPGAEHAVARAFSEEAGR